MGYGFLNGQQIIPGEFVQISGSKKLDETLSFIKNPYYAQVPKEIQVVLITEGDVTSSNFAQEMGAFSL